NKLPPFLVKDGGVNSGFMIMQYTAASLVSENKVLAHPASVDSIPSSANQEDHVSMGTIAARKARTILENAQNVLAIELLSALQAVDLRTESEGLGKSPQSVLSAPAAAVYGLVRSAVPMVDKDRIMYEDIEKVRRLIADGAVLRAAEQTLEIL
ncbi:MAG TPA: aromatic amino acid lyase, partial [Spirochaetia bacterium]|nr:aromatic amino acid lyase [Spirochaetia bacterium]